MRNFVLLLLPFACLGSGIAYAQDAVDSDTVVKDSRPTMPNLFFTREQRRILEAIRQGVIEKDTFVADDFLPLVILDEAIPEGEEATNERSKEINIDAFIRNRSSGNVFISANGEWLNVGEDNELLGLSGVSINADELSSGADSSIVRGEDFYNSSDFELKVGQVLEKDGHINEQLPVIRKKK